MNSVEKTVPQLNTRRFILRGIREEDTEAIVRFRSDPEVYRFFLNPTAITSEGHLNWYHNCYLKDQNRMDWVAIDPEVGSYIGVFGLKKESDDVVEVSYLLAPEWQGRGYAAECVERLIVFGTEAWGAKEVIATIHRENVDSRNFIEKLGFKEEHLQEDRINQSNDEECFLTYRRFV